MHGVHLKAHQRVLGCQLLVGGGHLGPAHVAGRIQPLPLQVAFVHGIGVEQTQGAHAGGGQVLQHRAAQPAAVHDQHGSLPQLLLTR